VLSPDLRDHSSNVHRIEKLMLADIHTEASSRLVNADPKSYEDRYSEEQRQECANKCRFRESYKYDPVRVFGEERNRLVRIDRFVEAGESVGQEWSSRPRFFGVPIPTTVKAFPSLMRFTR
jgi:hypothetical protein